MNKIPLILAVDTSCDDTSASVLKGNTILSNIIASQTELHRPYGGVFPTVAKQAHKENIEPTVKVAIKRAGVALGIKNFSINKIDALAVTVGPGLAPALEVGINYMKDLATKWNKPLIAVNHIEGHALSALAEKNNRSKKIAENKQSLKHIQKSQVKTAKLPKTINFPVLSVIVSGGHTEFVLFNKIGDYKIIGSTIDDAAGECLDKIGRMLNLGYPAGPVMEKFARMGNPKAVEFPLPMTTTKNFDMSFSGLKTFARNYVETNFAKTSPNKEQTYDLCASTQYGVFRHIMYKLSKVLETHQISEIWLGGGVAANIKLRQMIRKTIKDFENKSQKNAGENPKLSDQKSEKKSPQTTLSKELNKITFRVPHTRKLCMDNAAMIGLVANFKFERKEFVSDLQKLERAPRLKIA